MHALARDTLRGLVNLAPSSTEPIRAARVMGANDQPSAFGIDAFLPHDREVLAWSQRGQLIMIRLSGTRWEVRAVRDDELRTEHTEPIVRAAYAALERHVTRTDRTVANYERVSKLASRLLDLMGIDAS